MTIKMVFTSDTVREREYLSECILLKTPHGEENSVSQGFSGYGYVLLIPCSSCIYNC
jgi:hypothetical protein